VQRRQLQLDSGPGVSIPVGKQVRHGSVQSVRAEWRPATPPRQRQRVVVVVVVVLVVVVVVVVIVVVLEGVADGCT